MKKIKFDEKVFLMSSVIAVLIAIISIIISDMKFLERGGLLILVVIFMITNCYHIKKKMQKLQKMRIPAIIISIISFLAVFFTHGIYSQICAIICCLSFVVYADKIQLLIQKYYNFFLKKDL